MEVVKFSSYTNTRLRRDDTHFAFYQEQFKTDKVFSLEILSLEILKQCMDIFVHFACIPN